MSEPAFHSHIHTPYVRRLGEDVNYRNRPDERVRINLVHAPPGTPAVGPVPDTPHHDTGNAPPYKWICKLRIRFGVRRFEGTGFLVNIPGSTECTLLTAAHCLYRHDPPRYADVVEVTFPGEQPVTVTSDKLKAPSDYMHDARMECDYGLIFLPDRKLKTEACGFGLAAMMLDRKLLDANLSVFGYPVGSNDLWGTGGQTQSVEGETVRYLLQTTRGQSGSPIIAWCDGFWTVIGIHVRYEPRGGWIINSGVRLNVSVMNTITQWIHHHFIGVSLQFGTKNLSIDAIAPTGAGQYGKLVVKSQPEDCSALNLIPVKSFPEGSDMRLLSSEWVILSAEFTGKLKDTAVCVDPSIDINLNIGQITTTQAGPNIGTCSHLRSPPILRRACELFTLSDPIQESGRQHWIAKSVRYKDVTVKVLMTPPVVVVPVSTTQAPEGQ